MEGWHERKWSNSTQINTKIFYNIYLQHYILVVCVAYFLTKVFMFLFLYKNY